MPSKSKKNKNAGGAATATAASAPATPSPAAAPPAPVTKKPEPEVTASDLTRRLEALAGGKEKMSMDVKAAEEELNRLLKNPKKRVQGKSEDLDAQMKSLEFKRNTTSMSLTDEKKLLREIENIKVLKIELVEFETFNERVQVLKETKKTLVDKLKLAEAQEKEIQLNLRKIQLAEKLGTSIKKFETISIAVPKDKMGLVVGKGFAKLRQLEESYHVLLDVESGSQVVTCTSLPSKNAELESILENIASASLHTVAVRPETLKLLMIQKGRHLKALEAECFVKIDVNRAENIITFTSSQDRVLAVENAIQDLTTSSVTIDVPQDVLPKLIGKKGEVITKIMEDSGALLDIDRVVNTLRIIGPKESVSEAKAAVDALVYEQGALTIDVKATDETYFGKWDASKFPIFIEYLMTEKAARLRDLRKEALECRLQAVKAKGLFEANGNRAQLEALKSALRNAVVEFEARIVSLEVNSNCLSLIIGKKGAKIKSIEQESGGARVDISGNTVSVIGAKEQIDSAVALIEEIIANNQRVVVHVSSFLIPSLLSNKRAKLSELESGTSASIQLPPANPGKKTKQNHEVPITITGTTSAIEKAARLIEELNQAHQVLYIPLDLDEVTTVIGKKGETIHKLEDDTGAKLRVLDADENSAREMEIIGDEAQVAAATAAIDALLNTANRQVLTFDDFAIGVLIGRKGEQIKKLRESYQGVSIDLFPHGLVRVKGVSKELVDSAVAGIIELLQSTVVQDTIKLPADSRHTFDSYFKDAAISLHITELEAEGGVKATLQDGGKSVKIRGSALGLGKIKRFIESLNEPHAAVTIPLPSANHVASLKGTSADSLHENIQQVMKQTKAVIRFKTDKKSYSGVSVSIEGPSLTKVLEAKQRVEVVLQFFFPKHFAVLQKVPQISISKLFQTLPQLAKYHATLTLATKDAIKIFTDSEANTATVYKLLQEAIKAHLKEYKDLVVPAYLAPILVGKSGDTIKRLIAESQAKLTLSSTDDDDSTAPRTLTIHSKIEANIKRAVNLVEELFEVYESECVAVTVPLELLDLALAVKRKSPSNVSFSVEKKGISGAVIKIHAKDIAERAAALQRVEELAANSTALTFNLPTADIVGTLIGKGGVNIKSLQAAHPGLQVDIRKDDDGQGRVTLKGEKTAVDSAKAWLEDKIASAVVQQRDFQQRQQVQAAQEKARAAKTEAAAEAAAAQVVEVSKPKVNPGAYVPIGGEAKLNKNQRRHQRKRAEKQESVISMLVGGEVKQGQSSYATHASGSSNATKSGSSDYYHSNDGYSLRL